MTILSNFGNDELRTRKHNCSLFHAYLYSPGEEINIHVSNSTKQSPTCEVVTQLGKNFPAFYEARRSFPVLTRARQWTLSCSSRI
jgi:hypothetical protein